MKAPSAPGRYWFKGTVYVPFATAGGATHHIEDARAFVVIGQDSQLIITEPATGYAYPPNYIWTGEWWRNLADLEPVEWEGYRMEMNEANK